MSVRTCESVAQKLFIQCRDTGSTYKSLTASLRALRNVLGEVDEALDGHVGQQDDLNLPCGISKCEAILLKLEAALVLSRCSNQCEVNSNTIATFTKELDTASRELVTAYKKMTRTDVLSLSMRPDILSTQRTRSQSSRTSTPYCSTTKDIPGDTCSSGSAASSIGTTKRQSRSTTEKEVFYPDKQIYHHYHPDRANILQRSSSQASLRSKGSSSNARPDPYLASPFEAACGLIHNDDTLVGQMAKSELSWIPSAELQGDEKSPSVRKQQLPEVGAADLMASHGRKDSLLGDVEANVNRQTKRSDERVEILQLKVLDQEDHIALSAAEGPFGDGNETSAIGLTTTAREDAALPLNDCECDEKSSFITGDGLSTGGCRALAAYPARPSPPTPANTRVGLKELVLPTPLPRLPEDVAQSTALPDSDSEDDLYDSTPVMRPVPDDDTE